MSFEQVKKVEDNGTIKIYKGELHCEDGPAILKTNGTKEWYINGKQEDNKWLYEVATSISPDLELGKRKTILLAKAKLGDRIKGILQEQSIIKLTEIGRNNELSINSESKIEIINTVKDVVLENYLIDKSEVLRSDNNSYRTYIRIKVLKDNFF